MKTILVLLISEQTIPNILVAAHYRPDILWLVSTEDMEKKRKTESIVNTLRLRGCLPARIEKVVVDQDSLMDCMSKIEALIEGAGEEAEYIVNITGGNKVMALAAYEIFREIGQKVHVDYMPLGRNELVRFFPRKKPLKVDPVKVRLSLEEYLLSYGFEIQNKSIRPKAAARKNDAEWILDNYERLRGMLGFLYKHLGDKRKEKRYQFSAEFGRELAGIEKEMFERNGFEIKGRLVGKMLTKIETAFLTGGWLEEYVFNEACSLVDENVLDDAAMGVKIKSLSGAVNELDIAFMRGNVFYHIECKTLGEEGEQAIIRDEVYKKGAISALMGKGERRAFICTTQSRIDSTLASRANDYGIEILPVDQVRDIKNILKERFK